MGSSGGGSTSGRTDYPEYMKAWHESALGSGSLDLTLTQTMNSALDGVSPYAGVEFLSANDLMLGSGKHILDFNPAVTQLSAFASIDILGLINSFNSSSVLNTVPSESKDLVDNVTKSNSQLLISAIEREKINKFHSKMRDINAVMSSSFVIGESILRAQRSKALIEDFGDSKLRLEGLKTKIDLVGDTSLNSLRVAIATSELRKDISELSSNFSKLYAVARIELDNNNIEIAAKDKLWDLQVFQYGGTFLGSIHSVAIHTDPGDQSLRKGLSVGWGALSGGASGAMIGVWFGGVGAIVGWFVGAAAGGVRAWLMD
jgi:hypothetical protein